MASVWNDLSERFAKLARPSGPVRRPSWRSQLFDVLFALVITPPGVDYVLAQSGGSQVVTACYVFLTIVVCAVLSQRRRWPLGVLVMVVVLSMPLVADIPRITYYSCVIAAYSAAAYSRYRLPTLAIVLLLVVLAWEFTRDGMPTVPQQYVG